MVTQLERAALNTSELKAAAKGTGSGRDALPRRIGLWTAVAIVVGTTIGSGIFRTTDGGNRWERLAAYARPGRAVVLHTGWSRHFGTEART